MKNKLAIPNSPVSFLVHGLRSPRTLGAVAPSSRFSANVMARQVDLNKPGHVIELGAGTGSITSGLMRHGLPPERLIIIEREAKFVKILRKRFPKVTILNADASNLVSILKEQGVKSVNTIISVIPLLSLREQMRDAIIEQVFQTLEEGQHFIQLTYGRHSPIPNKLLHQHKINAKRIARVWRNLPPAKIWKYNKA